jgi:hypothetical protein
MKLSDVSGFTLFCELPEGYDHLTRYAVCGSNILAAHPSKPPLMINEDGAYSEILIEKRSHEAE